MVLRRLLYILFPLLVGTTFSGCLGSSGVSSGVKITNYIVGRALLSGQDGVSFEDIANLDAGKLYDVRKKYEGVGEENLTNAQLRLLCDLYSKFNDFSATMECLDSMESRSGGEEEVTQALLGRRALVYLQSGQFLKAAQLSQSLENDGGQYVHALAEAHLGKKENPRKIALNFSRHSSPRKIYFATAIYMALSDYRRALEVLESPRTRLLKDFGLMPYRNKLGQTIHPAVFRMDLFSEFNFGFFNAFSFAPKANVYVEFMAAKAYTGLGQSDEALQRFSFLIDNVGVGTFRDVLWMSLFERGKIRENQGDQPGAISDYQRAIELIEGIRSTIRSETGRVGFAGDKFTVYNRLIKLLVATDQVGTALEVVERSKGRALVDMLSARSSFGVSGADPQNAPALLDELAEAEANLLSAPVDLPAIELRRRLDALNIIRKDLEKQAPALASLVTVSPVSITDLLATVSGDETVLVFHHALDTLYTFVLADGNLRVYTGPIAGLDQEIKAFREAIADFQGESYRQYSKTLYRRLLEPVAESLDKQRLTIIPSGSLYYLPFAALLDMEDRFLVQNTSLRILPNLSVIPLLQTQELGGADKILVFGNPDRGDPAFDLPGTEMEAKAIGNLMGRSTVLLRQKATSHDFKQMASDFTFIHIASHGEFRSDRPLESRLLLAPFGDDLGDLKINDLYGLRLSARMVVLSACETALSYISPGDEMIGLQRGFLYAGTSGMIGSLWSIADESTTHLMTSLYKFLGQGQPPDKALHLAQIESLEEYGHPFFWAPFLYTGIVY